LFNLEEDPTEDHDRAADPSCRRIAEELLAKIHARWSAQRMLNGVARQKRVRSLIEGCGHGLMPHSVENRTPEEDANFFDFSQVPGWEEIRKRLAK
jgi:hypothetical protein